VEVAELVLQNGSGQDATGSVVLQYYIVIYLEIFILIFLK
jgi:hypothetical protein